MFVLPRLYSLRYPSILMHHSQEFTLSPSGVLKTGASAFYKVFEIWLSHPKSDDVDPTSEQLSNDYLCRYDATIIVRPGSAGSKTGTALICTSKWFDHTTLIHSATSSAIKPRVASLEVVPHNPRCPTANPRSKACTSPRIA